VNYWQDKQLHNPYQASLPWIIIPRTSQSEIVDYINALPPEDKVYFPGGGKTAELPPLTGRLHYRLGRREFTRADSQDFLVLGSSSISLWQSPDIRRKWLNSVQAQCQRPVVQNDSYKLCALPSLTAGDAPDFTPK